MSSITNVPVGQRIAAMLLIALVLAGGFAYHSKPVVQAQDNLTPGMLFGPLFVNNGQHVELCSSFLSPGTLTGAVHFRNLTTGEVTTAEAISIKSGGGACVTYNGKGRVVGMSRGEGPAADWVSPSNALIGTMSIVDDNTGTTRGTVQGVAKMWVVGL
jgi:hypothetical protein